MSILIHSAAVTDCHTALKTDVLIKDGRIFKIAPNLPKTADKIIDGTGLTLMPSFIDLHVHFREPGQTHKEDIESGCKAAVHGGYTTVNLMPNTSPIVSSMDIVNKIKARANQVNLCQVFQTVSITENFDGKTTSHLDNISSDIKWITDDGFGIDSTQTMLDALNHAKEKGIGLMLHEEDKALTHIDSHLSEEIPTFRDCQLAKLTGAKVHFCHVSTKNALGYIADAKRQGANVTLEVTPHHLMLTDKENQNVAPPLRTEDDRLALIDGIKAGLVDAIATDHAPHTKEEKEVGANGFTGLDLSFAACYTVLVRDNGIPLRDLSRLMSYNPARILGIEGGEIREGAMANLVLVDTEKQFIASEDDIISKSKNSPIIGKNLYGEINTTIWEGRIVYDKNNRQTL